MADLTGQVGTGTRERIMVPFSGPGEGTGQLSWGQRALWQVMREKQTWLPIGASDPVPPGMTLDDAVADLRFVMESYPTIRTRLRLEPDGPLQVVHGCGEVELEVVDAPDDADPAQVARDVWWEYWKRDYDFVTQWPVRMAVIRHRGQLTHRPWVMCHLVTDGSGALVILDELARRDCSGSAAVRTALEQAAWQASPAGQRQSRAALRYWEETLASLPARRFPRPAEPGRPRYWQATFDSRATYLAVALISSRTGVPATTVLLGLFAISLARVAGEALVGFQVIVNNRFRPGMAQSVAPVMQNGLCTVRVADEPTATVLAQCQRRAMVAYKHAYYDPDELQEVLTRVGQTRGEPVDIDCYFNDRRLTSAEVTGHPPTDGQVAEALPASSFAWTHQQDDVEFVGFAVNLYDQPDTIQMLVTVDTHRVAPADAEAVARGIEELAVASALDPEARALAAR